jgi:iron(III) transport system substrate-binding protein
MTSTTRVPRLPRRLPDRIGLAAGLIYAGLTVWSGPAFAQDLVIDGEKIADAQLLRAAKAEGSLLVYTANFEDSERPLLERFQQDTGIKAEMIRLATGRLFERVMTEFSGKKLQADIVGLTDAELQTRLVEAGVLVPHDVPSASLIPAALKEPRGYYYAMNRFPAVLGYNTKAWTKDQAPKSWKATLDPKFNGQVGIVAAAIGGSSWSVALFQRKVVDPQFWEKQAANAPRIYTSSAPLSDDVVRGEVTVGTVQMGLVRNLAKVGAPIALHFPSEGAPTVASVVGATSVARNPNAAKLYLNWVTSRRGGRFITELFADYATHPGVPPPNLSQYGIDVPPADRLWMADPADSRALRDRWVIEWDQIYRAKKGR